MKIVLVLLFILFIGCSPTEEFEIPEHIQELENLTVYPADVEPTYKLQLIRDQIFGDTDEVLIGRLFGIAADDLDRVFISDPDQYTVHVFQPEGRYLTSIGREGSGPSEFRSPPRVNIHLNQLLLYDSMQSMVHVYSLESLEYSHSVAFNQRSWSRVEGLQYYSSFPGLVSMRNDGTFLIRFVPRYYPRPDHPTYNLEDERYLQYYLLDSEGNLRQPADKIFEQRDREFLTTTIGGEFRFAKNFQFQSKSLLVVSNEDKFYAAPTSKEFLVEVYDPEGWYLRAFYYPIAKRTFIREEALRYVEERWENASVIEHRQSVILHAPEEQIPEHWPVLHSMLLDDEKRLWVSTIVSDSDVYEWWVLQETGEVIAKFKWPRDEPIELVKNGYLYARETDEMDLVSIVRYRIEMEER